MLKPPAAPTTVPRALLLGVAGGAVLLAILVMALVFWDDVLPRTRTEIQHDVQDQAEQIEGAHAAIVARDPDADAIAFGKVDIDWIGEAPAVCGTVDIDEPQDSLDGAERFVFIDGEVTLESLDGSAAVEQKWKDVCDDV